MSTKYKLNATSRPLSLKAKALRAQGITPAVVYGAKAETTAIQINAKEFTTLLTEANSEHFLLDLSIDGKSKLVLMQDVQHNYLTDVLTHADFLAVNDNTEIHTVVTVVLQGEPAGAKQGGMIDQQIHELPIKCKVKDLPTNITIDVTPMLLEETLRVGQVSLPKGVETSMGADVPVVVITLTAAGQSSQ